MSSPKTLEEQILKPVIVRLDDFSRAFPGLSLESKMQALEAASSRIGGFELDEFYKAFKISPVASTSRLSEIGACLVAEILKLDIPAALVLSALAREELDASERRNTGAYHTDFRLAQYLAKAALSDRKQPASIIDPACGTGMLLAAIVHGACGADRRKATEWLQNRIYAADMSATSLRGALLALASFSPDIGAITTMAGHWRQQDSLLAEQESWDELSRGGFELVVGNPPWEKVKATRHEFLLANGAERHYGSEYENLDGDAYAKHRASSSNYAAILGSRYKFAQGEIDLYVAFLEMFFNMLRPGGRVSAFAPAGLIRSQRNEDLRKWVVELSDKVSFTIFDNRARFFSIDTRFKFLGVSCDKANKETVARRHPLTVKHAKANAKGIHDVASAFVGRKSLASIRPDISVPEVHGTEEWSLFLKMSKNGVRWDAPHAGWNAEIVREVDMTADRKHFKSARQADVVPLIEGRMVQQHRFGAKAYRSGTGRSALWDALSIGKSRIESQFGIRLADLNEKARERAEIMRVGFCDITGQTNERSLMACIIPANVACGNKVPTITFPDDPSEERMLLWVGIANSFPFDWLLRQVVTTTVNFFVLLSIPMPNISKNSLPGREIIEASRELRQIDLGLAPTSRIADLRAKIDVAVMTAYGATPKDLELMLSNFPLLDRGQPPLPGENRSTITRDFLLYSAMKRIRQKDTLLVDRVSGALALGAIPYVPEEYSKAKDESELAREVTG